MSEGGRLPEASLNDSCAAKFSGFIQSVQHLDGGLPVDTSICDADTILESRGTIFRNVLPATVDIGLYHYTCDGAVASNQLLADGVYDLGLVEVVLERVSVRTVHHDAWFVLWTGLDKSSGGSLDVFGAIVRTLGATSKDDVNVLVAGGLDNGSKALLGDAHEGVGVGSGLHGVNGDTDAPISSVLKADGEGDTRGELTMELRLSGTSADSTPRDEVSNVLGRDGVEKLGPNGDTQVCKVAQELTGKAQTLVDLEGPVEVRVIDKTLPSDGCPWFFKVGTHDDEEVAPFWYL